MDGDQACLVAADLVGQQLYLKIMGPPFELPDEDPRRTYRFIVLRGLVELRFHRAKNGSIELHEEGRDVQWLSAEGNVYLINQDGRTITHFNPIE